MALGTKSLTGSKEYPQKIKTDTGGKLITGGSDIIPMDEVEVLARAEQYLDADDIGKHFGVHR